jgi:magnesium transporter
MTITIPTRNGADSPVLVRRTDSPEESSSRPRLSPTLARSFNPNGPESRERQRTLDVDMAIHLSRARQNSVTSPSAVSPFHPLPSAHSALEHPSLAANQLPSFSEGEEREFEAARAGGPGSAPPTIDAGEDIDAIKSEFPFGDADGSTQAAPAPRDVDMMYAAAPVGPVPAGHRPQVPIAGTEPFLPPVYQAAYGSTFDWGHMEQYASEEKRRLGLDTPNTPPSALRWLDANTPAARRVNGANAGASTSRAALDADGAETVSISGTDNGEGPATAGPSRVRQRKISQSAHVPRAARGPGKKTALFEGIAGAPPPSLTPGGNTVPASSALSSFENIFGGRGGGPPPPGGTPGGMGGHDRPYRFSFYSNALSATIHARSLTELPADGQSFEQLFQGVHPGADAEAAGGPPSATPTQYGSPVQSAMFAPAGQGRRVSTATRPGGFTGPEPVPGYPAMAGPMPSKGGNLSLGANPDGNTWWLDVLNPTDEEMKMLSKVCRGGDARMHVSANVGAGLRDPPAHDRGHSHGGDAREDRAVPELLPRVFPWLRPGPVQPDAP